MRPEPQKYGFIWFSTPEKVQNMVLYGVLGQKGHLYGKYGLYGKIWSCGHTVVRGKDIWRSGLESKIMVLLFQREIFFNSVSLYI